MVANSNEITGEIPSENQAPETNGTGNVFLNVCNIMSIQRDLDVLMSEILRRSGWLASAEDTERQEDLQADLTLLKQRYNERAIKLIELTKATPKKVRPEDLALSMLQVFSAQQHEQTS